ncbi:T-complex protein 1, eta subunit [Batrachochytrium salamandrivorans]|nr:T-complex protein 1, eta subunit [Batrachochytrium salamandrivorans]
MQPSIILLRQGTDVSQGKAQLISNINACEAVADAIRTTLGPRGMDKLVNSGGMSGATISNDGATILGLLDVVHPAARVMVDIAKAQDAEVGDGTTSVTLLASELLKESKQFIEDGEHPSTVIKGYRRACGFVLSKLGQLEYGVDETTSLPSLLQTCASTSLNSKLIARNKDFFSKMVVDAVLALDQQVLDLDMVGVKKVTGGSVTDSFLVNGVAFKKTFSYAGFEQQPKRIEQAKVLILQVELEHKSEKDNAEIRINDVAEYQRIVDAEWKIIYDKIDACSNVGANVVLSRLAIGDLATQKFADRGIFCAGRVPEEDLKRVALATGAKLQTTTRELPSSCLGYCGLFEERQVGGERYNILSDCTLAKSSTIVVRGGSEQFVEEAHRSLHDALMVVKRTIQSSKVVPGGGAVEMALATLLRAEAKSIAGKQQLVLEAFARALEVVPRTLCENAGFDPNDMVNLLKQKHHSGSADAKNFGVNLEDGGVHNTFEQKIWEPAANKRNSIASAAEAACVVLSIDETVRNPQSEQAQLDHRRNAGGAPVSQAMGGEGMRAMAPGVRTLQGKGGH